MKYLILALLVAFSLPATAATIHLNSSRSNAVEDVTSERSATSATNAATSATSAASDRAGGAQLGTSKAIVKSKSNITNNRENSTDCSVTVRFAPTTPECEAALKGKPSKEQIERQTPNNGFGNRSTINTTKSNSYREGGPSSEQVAPIRDTKSNASDRSTINGSKSNSYRLEGGKNDGDKAITFGRDQLKGSTKNSGHAVEK